MRELVSLFSSVCLMYVLLVLYAIGLGCATWIERLYGTGVSMVFIYHSPLFMILQLALVLSCVGVLFRSRPWVSGRWGMLLLHIALIVILCGAFLTHVSSEEGVIHLRAGHKNDQYELGGHGGEVRRLPFKLELEEFRLSRYAGSRSPSSYESYLRVYVGVDTLRAHVYMNHVLDIGGYRFYQSSYDRDGLGTILSINRDVLGRPVTYTGYLMLLLGFILSTLSPRGRIRSLFRQLGNAGVVRAGLVLLFCLSTSGLSASPEIPLPEIPLPTIPESHAIRFGSLAMQSESGRMLPVNTFASEVLRKLHRGTRIGAIEGDVFLLALLSNPEEWLHNRFVALGSPVSARHSLPLGYCAYADVFDASGGYLLGDAVEEAYSKDPSLRNNYDKELLKLDDRLGILDQLFRHRLLRLYPCIADSSGRWYAPGEDLSVYSGLDSTFVTSVFVGYLSAVRESQESGDWSESDELLSMLMRYQEAAHPELRDAMDLELRYNRLNIFKRVQVSYLLLGGLMLLCAFLGLFGIGGRYIKWLTRALGILVLIIFHFQMIGMGMRWRIGGHAPWSNSYETMVYVSWASVCCGLLFARRSALTLSLSVLFGGVILFVSSLNWLDPEISPLVPVLKSPWLMFHVAVIMMSYGFFGLGFLLGLTNLLLSVGRRERLAVTADLWRINEISLLLGLMLMTIGTFMGAIWANESWGRYWGWDPKETWALITIVVYTLVTHLHLLGSRWYTLRKFSLLSVLAFFSVLMTYFGVNYFLSGMHSYN